MTGLQLSFFLVECKHLFKAHHYINRETGVFERSRMIPLLFDARSSYKRTYL